MPIVRSLHRNPLEEHDALALTEVSDWRALAEQAAELRDLGWGRRITYSRKVFVPLTQLCRDVCHYCTFAKTPGRLAQAFLSADEALEIVSRGAAAGCKEVLFTLGDKPELRFKRAREALHEMGYATTLAYLEYVAGRVLKETGLLPHLNPGLLEREDFARLRTVAPSMGLMLESASPRLGQRGGPHFGSPDKVPARRLATLRTAGSMQVPMTSGILIGIGETRSERIEALLALRAIDREFGHLQEIIVQNFRAKPGTKMHAAPEPAMDELCWTIAVARLIFGPAMSIQAPPNLYTGDLTELVRAGINDWGGVSPVTPDHVNPEAPWPATAELARKSADAGRLLVNRLPVYPAYVRAADTWLAPDIATRARRMSDAEGFARDDDWAPGNTRPPPAPLVLARGVDGGITGIVERATSGERLAPNDIVRLFTARDADYRYVTQAADALRRAVSGDVVRYIVNRNINYTNICYFRCKFCAFSKGRTHEDLRGSPYDLTVEEITRRSIEAWDRGATEVCLQGGIHPDYTGATYEAICQAIKAVVPEMHIHAFSALEVTQGAASLGLPIHEFLAKLKAAGLSTLPGTAAEILDDEVRAIICPDKINTGQWLDVQRAAHQAGLRTTSTIMYGHVETSNSWAKHLLALRDLQAETGGFTEFVPLPFVHMEAPMYRLGMARPGPTFREAVIMHSVGRLALHPLITNIQTSWVKMGPAGAAICLKSGANDLGGTLMNESISRAAGTQHGQEFPPQEMEALIRSIGREPMQRDTLYRPAPEGRRAASMIAADLAPIVLTRPRKKAAVG